MSEPVNPDSSENREISHILLTRSLARNHETTVDIVPDAPDLARLARMLELTGLRKVSLRGTLCPVGRRDWRLKAVLGATVEQPCVVTLAPVTTRIDEPVERLWRADMPEGGAPGSDEEMPEDTSQEPLGDEIDLGRVLSEALALALPAYPRSTGATLERSVFAPPGITPMRDEDARPFAQLAAMRDRLSGGSGGDPQDGNDGNT